MTRYTEKKSLQDIHADVAKSRHDPHPPAAGWGKGPLGGRTYTTKSGRTTAYWFPGQLELAFAGLIIALLSNCGGG